MAYLSAKRLTLRLEVVANPQGSDGFGLAQAPGLTLRCAQNKEKGLQNYRGYHLPFWRCRKAKQALPLEADCSDLS